ncbi:MAG: adenosine kinase [Alphaproteobacteria bacterium]
MTEKKYGVVGIGNSIVDILCYKSHDFLKTHHLRLGRMKLVSEDEVSTLYRSISSSTECSGGSVANSMVGFASLGGKSAFIGKVGNDYFGKLFADDLVKNDVFFHSLPATNKATARSIIIITRTNEDDESSKIERSMATYLGVSSEFAEEDIDAKTIADSKVLLIEGYLLDSEKARNAIKKAIKIAEENKVEIAITLSDPECVLRHRDDFLKIIKDHAKIFIGNIHEVEALLQTNDRDEIIKKLADLCSISVMTMSEEGSYIINNKKIYMIDVKHCDEVYDVTGAGDLYAAGFLYGYTQGYNFSICGNIASYAASETLRYIGARPLKSLKDLPAQVLKDLG